MRKKGGNPFGPRYKGGESRADSKEGAGGQGDGAMGGKSPPCAEKKGWRTSSPF